MDREKVIEGIRHCYEVKGCDGCPYEEGCAYAFDNDEKPHCPIMDDILAMLKEQEVKEQIFDAIHKTAKQFRQTIVRCNHCKHYDEETGRCDLRHVHGCAETWFCADGERS